MRNRRLLTLAAVAGLVLAGCSDDSTGPEATGSRDAFCAELRTAVEDDLTVFDPTRPVAPDQSAAALGRLADAAPPEIAAEMRLIADEFAALVALFAEIDPADPEAAARLDELGIDPAVSDAASRAVTDYGRDECGIDVAAINAAAATTMPPPPTVPPSTLPATTLPPPTTLPPATG